MPNIAVLGAGPQSSVIINEMIERRTEGIKFIAAEAPLAIDKIIDDIDMIFVIFDASRTENSINLALEITRAAKLAEVLTIAVPIPGNAAEEYIQNFNLLGVHISTSAEDCRHYFCERKGCLPFQG